MTTSTRSRNHGSTVTSYQPPPLQHSLLVHGSTTGGMPAMTLEEHEQGEAPRLSSRDLDGIAEPANSDGGTVVLAPEQ
eukprot:Skav218334  [mRNA]  locus=scaffold755:344619:348976:+ [translate_table: standard]